MSEKKDEAQQQEPVAWYDAEKDCAYTLADCEGRAQDDLEPLYLEPPSKPWVGLTRPEIAKASSDAQVDFCLDKQPTYEVALARAIEAKLREKNGLV